MTKKFYNMTGEDIQSNEELFIENNPKSLTWVDVFWLLLFCFFTIGFFVQTNRIEGLENQLKEEKLLNLDLQELYKKK